MTTCLCRVKLRNNSEVFFVLSIQVDCWRGEFSSDIDTNWLSRKTAPNREWDYANSCSTLHYQEGRTLQSALVKGIILECSDALAPCNNSRRNEQQGDSGLALTLFFSITAMLIAPHALALHYILE